LPFLPRMRESHATPQHQIRESHPSGIVQDDLAAQLCGHGRQVDGPAPLAMAHSRQCHLDGEKLDLLFGVNPLRITLNKALSVGIKINVMFTPKDCHRPSREPA
jgi:hypothetical protein